MTAPSPTDNIVDLAARSAATRHDGNNIIAAIRAHALRQLGKWITDLLEKADDTLFDFVQKSGGGVSNQDYFDAMREVRVQRPVIERRYLDHLNAAFVALERRTPMEVDLQHSVAESRELSLVSEDQLEEQLAASMTATSLSRSFKTIIGQLNYRLGVAVGLDALEDGSNPLAPPHIAHAFRHALQGCDVAIAIKVLLFKLYEREMTNELGELYNEINKSLIDAGIAPNIKPAYARIPRPKPLAEPDSIPDSAGSEADPRAGAYAHGQTYHRAPPPAAPQGVRYVPMPETVAEQSVFASLHELLNGYRQVQQRLSGGQTGETPPPASAEAPMMSGHDVLSVLSLFQNEMPIGLREAVSDPSLSITQKLKQELLKGAEKLGMDPQARMTAAHEDSIDLVGMLFDVLLDERDFRPDVRMLIGRLIVPFIKVAMLDRRMFLQKTHPARRLLNALAEACEGNTGEAPQERELMGRVEGTIDRLVAEFNEDIAIFEALEQEFRDFIEQHRRRAVLAERRAAEAQRGKERLDHARALSAESLRQLLEGRDEMPPAINAFLRRYWTHHLTLCLLRNDGEMGDVGQQIIQTGAQLADLPAMDNVVERGLQFEALRSDILPILQSAGCMGGAAEDVLQSLRRALMPENETRAAAEVVAETITALERNAPAAEPLPEPESAATEEAEPAPALEYDEADAERLRKLEVGSWIQFTEEGGTVVPIKLSWISPISNRMLFVNRRGLRYCVASPEELAAMMREGKISIRQNDAAFEHAMSQVLGKLRSGTQVTRRT